MVHIVTGLGTASIDKGRWYATTADFQKIVIQIGEEIVITAKDGDPDYARASYVADQLDGSVVSVLDEENKDFDPAVVY